MIVVKPVDGRVAAERRLAARMLCLEHGAISHGADLAPKPPPHEPYPVVELPPCTKQGLPILAHYRPTVGVVFYTAGEGFVIREFVESLSALLAGAGEEHLKGARAVAASPSAVLRHRGRVRGGHLLVGPRKCSRKPPPPPETGGYPARLLQWTPPSSLRLPPHWSSRAAFTWVFMPVTAALALGAGPYGGMDEVNAAVAAVFYDGGLLSRHADGASAGRLTLADFGFPELPARFGEGAGPAAASGHGTGALLYEGAGGRGRLTFVGQHLCLGRLRAAGRPAAVCDYDPGSLLSFGAAGGAAGGVLAESSALGGGAAPQCWACAAPLGGEALVVRDPRAPPSGAHREWFFSLVPPSAPLLPAGARDKGLLLCYYCWGFLESPGCLTEHMGAHVSRVVIPFSQAEACAATPGYACLAPLLSGQAAPVRGVDGAFTVTLGGETVVLAGENLGAYPALSVPELAALRLPIIAGLRLVEARGGAHSRK